MSINNRREIKDDISQFFQAVARHDYAIAHYHVNELENSVMSYFSTRGATKMLDKLPVLFENVKWELHTGRADMDRQMRCRVAFSKIIEVIGQEFYIQGDGDVYSIIDSITRSVLECFKHVLSSNGGEELEENIEALDSALSEFLNPRLDDLMKDEPQFKQDLFTIIRSQASTVLASSAKLSHMASLAQTGVISSVDNDMKDLCRLVGKLTGRNLRETTPKEISSSQTGEPLSMAEKTKLLFSMFAEHIDLEDIANRLNMTLDDVESVLASAGVMFDERGLPIYDSSPLGKIEEMEKPPVDKKKIIDLFERGLTGRQIAEKLGIPYDVVEEILEEKGEDDNDDETE